MKNLPYSDNMIYEIAEDVRKTLENKCDDYEIYIDEGKAIELDSLKDELNFAKEEIEFAKNCGVQPVTLGANILRAQTAAACAVWALANL